MDHAPNSDTFQKHYLNRNVCADLWAIARAQDPQQHLIKQVTSHGSSRDPRRPVSLTREQVQALHQHPRYAQLTDRLSSLRRGAKEREKVSKERHALLEKLRKREMKRVREEWNQQQATDDINRQMQGQKFEPVHTRPMLEMNSSQREMFDALTAPLANTTDLAAQSTRRNTAVAAVAKYCLVEEFAGMSNQMMMLRDPSPPPELMSRLTPLEQAHAFKASVFGNVGSVSRCFVCIAKVLTLPPDSPSLASLARPFYNHNSLSRHFINVHLSPLSDEAMGHCPICLPLVSLDNKRHLQRHAEDIHGIRSSRRKR